jgi:hypothetical protein
VNCKSYETINDSDNFIPVECNKTDKPSEIMGGYCVRYEFDHKGFDLLWIDISIEPSNQPNPPVPEFLNNDNSSDLNFFYSTNASNFRMLSIYLAALKTDKKTYHSKYTDNSFFLTNGQVAIIDYLPIMRKYMTDKYAYGLAGGIQRSTIEFDARMNVLPLRSFPSNTIQLGLKPRSFVIQRQEEEYYRSKY